MAGFPRCFAALILVLSVCSAQANEQGATASPPIAPPQKCAGATSSLIVDAGAEPLTYDNTRSIAELSGDHGNGTALGFTDRNYHYDIDVTPVSAKAGCFGVNVHLHLQMQRPVIYVASDFPAGSCGYDLVLTHERKHWELARASFPKIKTKLEAKLADELAEGGFRFASAAEAAEKMRGYLGKLAYEAVKGVYLDELAQQAAIDSGSEIRGMVKALRQCQQVANAR